ncbi:hypothetical protein [Klebsiella phage vB_KshKPC-M]|nr:hypothetical protein [Klebsiella phage vB_KshKPC-M]
MTGIKPRKSFRPIRRSRPPRGTASSGIRHGRRCSQQPHRAHDRFLPGSACLRRRIFSSGCYGQGRRILAFWFRVRRTSQPPLRRRQQKTTRRKRLPTKPRASSSVRCCHIPSLTRCLHRRRGRNKGCFHGCPRHGLTCIQSGLTS